MLRSKCHCLSSLYHANFILTLLRPPLLSGYSPCSVTCYLGHFMILPCLFSQSLFPLSLRPTEQAYAQCFNCIELLVFPSMNFSLASILCTC